MASNKRKTLQIKRPDPNSPKSKKKSLPKVKMDENTATSAIDTDELGVIGKEGSEKQGDESANAGKPKANTTRISLPDEDKIRKARRATTTQNLEEEDSLPSADQIEQAQKNATMPIMIDTEDLQDTDRQKLEDSEESDADRTMEIDVDSMQTGDVGKDLQEAGASGDEDKDQTLQIDPDALATGNVGEQLEKAGAEDDGSDKTMEIDSDALATGNVGEQLEKAGAEDDGSDKTMEIDADSLATGRVDQIDEDTEELMASETMKMEDPLTEEEVLEQEKAFNAATTSIDEPVDESESGDEQAADTDLTAEEMKESFNAMTMEMDPSELEREFSKSESAPQEAEKDELDQTMDMTQDRPKTIMIKRPSRDSGSSTPTVKAVRPDAATVRTSRPVTASPSSAKEDTSRVDVPEGASVTKEGKTIKLRRPSGAPGSRVSPASRVAGSAGLAMGDDGTVRSTMVKKPDLGGGWLAVAIITFLVSLGAIWTTVAISQPELPMPGRLVDVNQNLVARP